MLNILILSLFLCVMPFGAPCSAEGLMSEEQPSISETMHHEALKSFKTLHTYLTAIYSGNLQKAYELLSDRDKKIIDQELFFSQKQLFADPAFKDFHARARFEITLTNTEENKAEFHALQELLDLTEINLAMLEILRNNPDELNPKEAIRQAIIDRFKGNWPAVPTKISSILIKENNVWKVSEPELLFYAELMKEM